MSHDRPTNSQPEAKALDPEITRIIDAAVIEARCDDGNAPAEIISRGASIIVFMLMRKSARTGRPKTAKLIQAAEAATGRPVTSVTEFPDGSAKVEIGNVGGQQQNARDVWRAEHGR